MKHNIRDAIQKPRGEQLSPRLLLIENLICTNKASLQLKGFGIFFFFLSGSSLRAEVKTKQMLLDGASALRGRCCSRTWLLTREGRMLPPICERMSGLIKNPNLKELHDPPE